MAKLPDWYRQRAGLDKQRGSIMLAVFFLMILLALLASSLVNHFVTNEADAIAKSLVRVRAYWAMAGHANFVASRTRSFVETIIDVPLTPPTVEEVQTAIGVFDYDGLVPTDCPNVLANTPDADADDVLHCIFDELDSLDGAADDSVIWSYDYYSLTIENRNGQDGAGTDVLGTFGFVLTGTGTGTANPGGTVPPTVANVANIVRALHVLQSLSPDQTNPPVANLVMFSDYVMDFIPP